MGPLELNIAIKLLFTRAKEREGPAAAEAREPDPE
jgi:hypothetical protein